MAADLKKNKRKGADKSAPAAKKLKPAPQAELKKDAKPVKPVPASEAKSPAKSPAAKAAKSEKALKDTGAVSPASKAGRKRAADFFEADGTPVEKAPPAKVKKVVKGDKQVGNIVEQVQKVKEGLKKAQAAEKEMEQALKKVEEFKKADATEKTGKKAKKAGKQAQPEPELATEVEQEATEADKPKESKKSKKNKKASKAEPESVQEESTKATADEEPMPTSISRPKKSKKSKQSESKPAPEPANDDFAGFESEDDGSEDEGNDAADHTAALLAGFESEDEESGAETGMDVEKLPAAPISAKARKQLSKANSADKPGTIYVGRIPHGFYEPQMQAYFSQFGNVTRLRLSRNKLTGRSKHYAFIEFDSAAVADVVVKTMDNYLLYQHILKVRRVPDDQVHPDLWKGANHRFKAIPRARIEARRLERPADREVWEKRVDREVKRRRAREQKLKASGLDYTFEAPRVKLVADVARKEPAAVAETEPESPADAPEVKMLDAPKEVQTVEALLTKAKGLVEVGDGVDEVEMKVTVKSKKEKKEKPKAKYFKKPKA